ncbi:MAG: 4-hydroxy-3-methylbut-2-enyl diphosphate reductase [Gemmataceae bacterium]|nr:4-hydroxy-3-methylbut-2-enyl diphosphate reductase [Gemmataceae bacterium]
MKVIVADVLGMCFGVRDALAAIDQVQQPAAVTIHGELVHNEQVLSRLAARGFRQVHEDRRQALPVTDTVLITAHGVSDRERARLASAGKNLIDTTCPLVERAHEAAKKLRDEGYHVLVVGKPGHVEVEGLIEDLPSHDVISSPEDVKKYPHPRLGVVCQTTTQVRHADSIRAAIARKNPSAEIRFVDTICHPTKDHQKALEKMLDQVQAVVVVGGRNSNNTRQLVARCRARGLPAYHVQTAADLQAEWFDDTDTVGLTAGTSTLDETIAQVRQALQEIAHSRAQTALTASS